MCKARSKKGQVETQMAGYEVLIGLGMEGDFFQATAMPRKVN